MPGHQIVHATLCAPVPWREGFALIDGHLRAEGRSAWGLLVDGANPIARTNVAPRVGAPAEPSLYAFGYTATGATRRPTFVVAGSGEVDRLNADTIVRRGETSPDAIREKAAFVVSVMQTRLRGLGADWPDVTAIDVYTPHPIEAFVMDLRGVAREIII